MGKLFNTHKLTRHLSLPLHQTWVIVYWNWFKQVWWSFSSVMAWETHNTRWCVSHHASPVEEGAFHLSHGAWWFRRKSFVTNILISVQNGWQVDGGFRIQIYNHLYYVSYTETRHLPAFEDHIVVGTLDDKSYDISRWSPLARVGGKDSKLLKTNTEFALEPKWLRAILVSASSQRFEGVYVIQESTESIKEVIQINSSMILNFSL